MTDKELRRLSKGDLIEIICKMKETEEELRAELKYADAQLRERNLKIEEAGSIAEAAIRINGVFEAAQQAAEDYLQQIYSANSKIEMRCERCLKKQKLRAGNTSRRQRLRAGKAGRRQKLHAENAGRTKNKK